MKQRFSIIKIVLFCALLCAVAMPAAARDKAVVFGKIVSAGETAIDYATVYLKNTHYWSSTDENGIYRIEAPSGKYILVVTAVGFHTLEKTIEITAAEPLNLNLRIEPDFEELDEIFVIANQVSQAKRSAFNAVEVNTRELQNSTKNLSDALSKTPGMKLRESGGVGSDMQLMLDGFSGKHVKVFIDGVPQEGVGSSFSLNNIPVNFAERIEVYKGVVPVGFGADAIGGVVNIVTNKKRRSWFLDASYSYGSFNTHKSYVNFGQTLKNGFSYEINAFQNYSDNSYWVDAPIKDFETGRLDTENKIRVRRFHDTYHNEAVIAKIGVIKKAWADRMMFSFTFSNMYQDIQTGVRQSIVYGEKHRKGYSLMPSFEYSKLDLFTKGFDLLLTANYNKNLMTNVDTSAYEYNWLDERHLMNSRGEQSYQHTRSDNNNWNGTVTLNYRLGRAHVFTFNDVVSVFRRSNTSLLTNEPMTDAIDKQTRKNIAGLSYRFTPSKHWNLSVFGKHYYSFVSGPIATTSNQDEYVRTSHDISSFGYGIAGTYFILSDLQVKISYEKAYRLPTIEEMFGNEDLEMGDIGIRPENSDNINLNISFNHTFDKKHGVYLEAGAIYRNTKDYIQRNITDLSGGKQAASYINYGKVLTKGYHISARYNFSKWLSIGGNFTQMDVRDNQRTSIGSGAPNIAYGERMPNLPYLFADSDITFYYYSLFKKGNTLTVTYDNHYLHSFTYYSSIIGANQGEYVVPEQFSHNISISYSFEHGKYSISLECKNFTDEKLYDNFSLQKAGRAFYGKFRVSFGN